MKRFFCTVCQKVKRVRRWPVLLENQESIHANMRVGACNKHSDTRVFNAVVNTPAKVRVR